MKLIIDIPEKAYKLRVCNPVWYDSNMDKAIRNGTLLEDELKVIKEDMKDTFYNYKNNRYDVSMEGVLDVLDKHIEEIKSENNN